MFRVHSRCAIVICCLSVLCAAIITIVELLGPVCSCGICFGSTYVAVADVLATDDVDVTIMLL